MPVIKPSLPKGTRDFLPEQMFRRQFVMNTVRGIFEMYGYEPLETPAIERVEVLSGKYGDEGEKLIFKVLKRGTGLENLLKEKTEFVVNEYSELVEEALRYDLTVPLSRVIAMYQNQITFPFKRYQIQPVWRADRPQRGRYREFYQCDVDIIGTESMLADAETIAIVNDVLTDLGFKKFKIRINNRKILNGLLQYAAIAPELSTAVFIAIDKLEKIGLDGVINELKKRDLSDTQIHKLVSVLELTGKPDKILQDLGDSVEDIASLRQGRLELKDIDMYLKELNVPADRYEIDLFLVRGLGYYTGPIHEAVIEEPKMGSLTGGGRYDRLIGMFLGRDIPATGAAFGIERIIDVMRQLEMFPEAKTKTQVLVTLFDESTRKASLDFSQELRKADIHAEVFLELAKFKKQLSYADKKKIPYVAIIGPDEQNKNKVTIKNMTTGKQQTVSKEEAVAFLEGTTT